MGFAYRNFPMTDPISGSELYHRLIRHIINDSAPEAPEEEEEHRQRVVCIVADSYNPDVGANFKMKSETRKKRDTANKKAIKDAADRVPYPPVERCRIDALGISIRDETTNEWITELIRPIRLFTSSPRSVRAALWSYFEQQLAADCISGNLPADIVCIFDAGLDTDTVAFHYASRRETVRRKRTSLIVDLPGRYSSSPDSAKRITNSLPYLNAQPEADTTALMYARYFALFYAGTADSATTSFSAASASAAGGSSPHFPFIEIVSVDTDTVPIGVSFLWDILSEYNEERCDAPFYWRPIKAAHSKIADYVCLSDILRIYHTAVNKRGDLDSFLATCIGSHSTDFYEVAIPPHQPSAATQFKNDIHFYKHRWLDKNTPTVPPHSHQGRCNILYWKIAWQPACFRSADRIISPLDDSNDTAERYASLSLHSQLERDTWYKKCIIERIRNEEGEGKKITSTAAAVSSNNFFKPIFPAAAKGSEM